MKLLQLYYFKILAEHQHLTITAQKLFISPPALSACISRLEEELGVTLFEHVGRNIILNNNGQILYKHVKNVFSSLENAQMEIKEANSLQKQAVNIAVSASTLWSDSIMSYYKKHPEISINQTSLKLDKLQDHDYTNQFDLIITCIRDLNSSEWENVVIIPEDRPVLVVYPNHPYANLKSLSLIEAKDEPFIALTKGYSSRRYFDEMCDLAGFTPKIVVEGDYSLRTEMVEKEYGISFSTVLGSKSPILKGLKFVEIKYPVNCRIQVIFWRKGRELSNAAKLFRDYIINYYKDYNPSI